MRDGAEVEDLCQLHQPVALLVTSPLLEEGTGHRTRCWAVGDPGRELGLLTVVHVAQSLAVASALVLDPAAAPTLATLLRRSGAVRLVGGADHVDSVARHVAGAQTTALELLARRTVIPPQPGWQARTRVAGPDDVPALVALYRRFELEGLAPAVLERSMAGLVRQQRVVVATDGGEVVAAMRVEARSRHWDLWGGLTVPTEHRGKGLSRVVDARAWAVSVSAGRGMAGVRALTNHVPHEQAGITAHAWHEVRIPVDPSVPRRARRWARRQARRTGLGGAAR